MTTTRVPGVAAEVIAIRPRPPLTGTVTVDGSKNAALPLVAAAAAVGCPVRLNNIRERRKGHRTAGCAFVVRPSEHRDVPRLAVGSPSPVVPCRRPRRAAQRSGHCLVDPCVGAFKLHRPVQPNDRWPVSGAGPRTSPDYTSARTRPTFCQTTWREHAPTDRESVPGPVPPPPARSRQGSGPPLSPASRNCTRRSPRTGRPRPGSPRRPRPPVRGAPTISDGGGPQQVRSPRTMPAVMDTATNGGGEGSDTAAKAAVGRPPRAIRMVVRAATTVRRASAAYKVRPSVWSAPPSPRAQAA